MITPFRDVVSAYKFLHPLPATHPIHPINIGLFRGGNDIDPVSQSTGVNDLTQIVDEQTLQVTPVDTPVNDFVSSMSCFKPPCCHTSNDSLLQKIESLEGIINEYEEKIHPTPLYCPGMIGFHPDGTPDHEARAIMKNTLVLAETLSAAAFESLCIRFNEKNLKYRVGIASARADIAEKIDGLIPFSSEDVKEIVVRAISTCAARMLVWKPEAKEECQDLECKSFCMRCNCLLCNIIL